VGVGNVTWLLGHGTSHAMSQYLENADPRRFHASVSTFAATTWNFFILQIALAYLLHLQGKK